MSARPENRAEPAAKTGFFRQVSELLGALRVSPVAKTLVALMGAIVVVVALTAYGQIELNSCCLLYTSDAADE